jgi:hypothetical protein
MRGTGHILKVTPVDQTVGVPCFVGQG